MKLSDVASDPSDITVDAAPLKLSHVTPKDDNVLERPGVRDLGGDLLNEYGKQSKEEFAQLQHDFTTPLDPAKSKIPVPIVGNKAVMDRGVKTAIDALGYLTSPISAAATSLVGRPVEAVTGLPRRPVGDVVSMLAPFAGEAHALAQAPVLEQILGGVGRGLNTLTGQKVVSPAASAAGRIREWLKQDGVPNHVIEAEIKRFQDHGITSNLLNVAGPNTKAGVRAAASKMGPGRAIAVKHQAQVEAGLPGEARAATKVLGADKRPLHELKEHLEKTQKELAEKMYPEAYKHPVLVTPEIVAEVRDKEGVDAIDQAIRAARSQKRYDQVKELESLKKHAAAVEKTSGAPQVTGSAAVMLKDPAVPEAWKAEIRKLAAAPPAPPTVSGGALDRVRIALGRRGKALSHPEKNEGDVGAGLFDRSKGLSDILDNVPHLKEARATFHALSDQIRAAEFNEDILSETPEEFSDRMAKMDPKSIEVLRTVNRQQLADSIGRTADPGRLLKKISHAPYARDNLRALHGAEEGDKFADGMELRLRRLKDANYVDPDKGSKTEVLRGDKDALGMIKDAMHAHTSPLTFALSKLAKGATTMTPAEAEMIVRQGLLDNPSDVLQQVIPSSPQAAVTSPVNSTLRAALLGTGLGSATKDGQTPQ